MCSGIGGFRIAIENFEKSHKKYKFKCILSADIKGDAIKTYNLNFNEDNKPLNIYDIDNLEQFDLLCAGFPCQPFSSAGNKNGFDDERGGIIFKIIELCNKYRPNYVILENVSNLLTIDNGSAIEKICTEFNNINYNVTYKKLNASDFGIPQKRERVFIVCSLKKKVNLENITYCDKKPKLKSIIDTSAMYSDIDNVFSQKILNLHKQTPLYGHKLQDKRGGSKNIHSWDIGLNGDVTMEEKELMGNIMLERRKKHWAEKKNIDWMDGWYAVDVKRNKNIL